MPPTQYENVGGLVVALVALLAIVLICRWVFSTSHRDSRASQRVAKARARGDYGLLVPVATAPTADDAEVLRGVLRDAGIRATVAAGQVAGERIVLVFRTDADRARSLVSR